MIYILQHGSMIDSWLRPKSDDFWTPIANFLYQIFRAAGLEILVWFVRGLDRLVYNVGSHITGRIGSYNY